MLERYRPGRLDAHKKSINVAMLEHAAGQAIFDHNLLMIDHLEEQRRQVDVHVEAFAGQGPYRQRVRRCAPSAASTR